MRCDRCNQTLDPCLAEAYEDEAESDVVSCPVEIVCGWCHFGDLAEEADVEERLGK